MLLNNNNKKSTRLGGTKQYRKSYTVQLSQVTIYIGVHLSHCLSPISHIKIGAESALTTTTKRVKFTIW